MLLPGLARLKTVLLAGRRERELVARLEGTRAGTAAVANMLRQMSAAQDAHAHLVSKVARASRGTLTETASLSPTRNLLLAQTADSLVRSKELAGDLDRAVEALERLAAALWDR